MKSIYQTEFEGLKLIKRGKVRDIYDAGEHLLIVATDRLSAFDCVFPEPIPMKGIVLTQISRYWFENTKDIIENHIASFEVEDLPENAKKYADELRGRTMLARKTDPLPVECVVRGYLHGSGWKEYKKTGSVCGIELPEGLREKDKLPEPIFTPATKAETGHDENITFERTVDIIGKETADFVKNVSMNLYSFGHEKLLKSGITLVDTKYEFGRIDNRIILIDECMTPDSSRFYVAETYGPDQPSQSFDKQYVRDYLETTDWDKTPPAPHLPDEIVKGASERYLEAYKIITGKDLET